MTFTKTRFGVVCVGGLWTGTGRVPGMICCRMTPQTHSIRPCNICIRRFSTKERQCHLYAIEQSTAGQASSGTRRFQTINRELARLTLDRRQRLEDELAHVRNQITANSILQDREFSFCLYPAEKLRRLMTGLREHQE